MCQGDWVPQGEAADDVEDVPLEGQAKATYLEYVRKMKAATTKDEIESVGLEVQATHGTTPKPGE